MWNHFSTKYERTNNRVEADNGAIKSNCGVANPDINKAVGLLREYQIRSSIMYKNTSKSNAIKYNSRIEDHDRDRDFRRAREQYRKGVQSNSTFQIFSKFFDLSQNESTSKSKLIR